MNAERAWWRHATCQPYFERAAGKEEQWRSSRASEGMPHLPRERSDR